LTDLNHESTTMDAKRIRELNLSYQLLGIRDQNVCKQKHMKHWI